MKKTIITLSFLGLLLHSFNLSAAAPVHLKDRQNILDVLKQYSPDSFFIIDTYDHAPRRYSFGNQTITIGEKTDFMIYIRGKDDYEVLENLDTAVHETNHGLNSLPYPFMNNVEPLWGEKYMAVYVGGDSVIIVPITQTFPSKKLAQIIPERMRTFRFQPYIIPTDVESKTQGHGIYGLLDELNSYYHGTKVVYDLYPFWKDVMKTSGTQWLDFFKNFEAAYFAYLEFKYFILQYLIYARNREQAIFEKIIDNHAFCTAFCQVDLNFRELIQRYFALKNEILQTIEKEGHKVSEDDEFTRIDGYGSGNFLAIFKKIEAELTKDEFIEIDKIVRQNARPRSVIVDGPKIVTDFNLDPKAVQLQSLSTQNSEKTEANDSRKEPKQSVPSSTERASTEKNINDKKQNQTPLVLYNDKSENSAIGNVQATLGGNPKKPEPGSDSEPVPHQSNASESVSKLETLFRTYFAENFALYGYGLKIGFVQLGSDLEATSAIGFHFPLGFLTEKAELGANVDYWNKSKYGTNFKSNWKAFSASFILKYYTASNAHSISPYLGGGIGINYTRAYHRASVQDKPYPKDEWLSSEVLLKLDGLAGIKLLMTPQWNMFFEIKFSIEDINSLGFFAGVDLLRLYN